jgi:5-methylcytosine-specific restriction endonuclease McrA
MSRRKCIDRRRRYDWSEIQRYYDEEHSIDECIETFGFCRGAWHKALKRGEFKTRPLARALLELLAVGKSRTNIKRRLLEAGLLVNRCQECGISEWLGEPLTVQLDHINGIRDDYRLENLRMLCPNCHSQTETYGRHNWNRRQRLQEALPVV